MRDCVGVSDCCVVRTTSRTVGTRPFMNADERTDRPETGVPNLFEIASDDPATGPLMVGADVASTNHKRPAGVVDTFQCSDDGVSAPSSEISAVLKSEPTRSHLSDDADSFEVEARTLAFDAAPLGVGAADVLAGRGADDDGWEAPMIAKKSGCREGADIVIDFHAGVVFGVDGAAPCLDLARSERAVTGSMHAERPTAGGSAEEVENIDHASTARATWIAT